MELTLKKPVKNKFGQYFTPEVVAQFMLEMADIPKNAQILEPSCGEGVFLKILENQGFENITAYEIDEDLAQSYIYVRYESFVAAKIDTKFDLIIGNPPYIRWKNLEDELKHELSLNPLWNTYFNSLCDYLYIFILKSIELLHENGQLIFICPEYWFNTTHSIALRNYMVANGHFETIYHFNETPIFDKVTVSIVIFKFIKAKPKNNTIKVTKFYANQKLTQEKLVDLRNKLPLISAEYLECAHFSTNERWLLETDIVRLKLQILEKNCLKKNQNTLLNLFNNEKLAYHTISDFCDIGNGLVSGLDKAFQVNGDILVENEQKAILKVVKAKDLKPFFAEQITPYIFLETGLSEVDFSENYPNFYTHFQKYKPDLEKRYQYSRTIQYWEWVFLRNFNLFSKQEKRIFVPCKERISNKNYFRFALLDADIFPTQDVTAIFRKANTRESIEYILAYLNQSVVFEWLKSNGIIKGNIVEFSEKPIASIPFRTIDWQNETEILIHNSIVQATKNYIKTQENKYLDEINTLFVQLFQL